MRFVRYCWKVSDMPKVFDIGRVVVIIRGRRAGRKAVVVDIIDENFVLVTGPKELTGVKRRRMNVDHLIPLSIRLPIERGADDKTVLEVIKKQGLENFMRQIERIPAERL